VKEIWDTLHNRQKVNVNLLTHRHLEIVEVEGRPILAMEVPRANRTDKPVYLGGDMFAGAYRRNGEGDYHCTKEEVRAMISDQLHVTQDLKVLEHISLDAFDAATLRRYRIRLQHTRPGHVWETLEDLEFLLKLGCVGRAQDGTLHPTAGGLLMFGFEYEIVKELPQYFLDYQEHDNGDTRWTDRVVSNLGDWSGNLYDFYTRVYSRLAQNAKTPFKLERDTRQDDTPVHTALREALANGLIHANYYGPRGLVIHRWPDVITIANPGGMRVSVDDAIAGGLSDPRNSTLIKMFNLINIGDRAGSGIPNIYGVWRREGWQRPNLQEQFNPDRTVLSLVFAPPA
jgi:predicted HTH transcriptional regulator